MNEILELHTGQVAFISSLIAGFSLTIAIQIIRLKEDSKLTTCSFLLFTLSTLLFLIALYIDVTLSLKTAGAEQISKDALAAITNIRNIGTSAATAAFFLFIVSIALMSWLQSKISGVITSIAAILVLAILLYTRNIIFKLPI